jgi:hypothetical protein
LFVEHCICSALVNLPPMGDAAAASRRYA